jgi:hypothetical protein
MGIARFICAFLLVTGAALSQDLVAFEASAGHDEIKGRPKTVKVEREVIRDDRGEGTAGKRFLEQQTDYRPDGKTAERHFWKPDGTLSSHEVYEYNPQGQRTTVTYLDDKGKTVRTLRFRRPDANTEEEIDEHGGPIPSTTTTRKFDEQGHMIEMSQPEANGGGFSGTMRYDEQGRPVEMRIALKAGPGGAVGGANGRAFPSDGGMRVHILYQGDNKAVVTVYGPDESILMQTESTEEDAGGQMQRVLFSQAEMPEGGTAIFRVNASDAQGNWTRRTELRRNERTQVDEPVAVLHRAITYY